MVSEKSGPRLLSTDPLTGSGADTGWAGADTGWAGADTGWAGAAGMKLAAVGDMVV